MKPSSGAYIGVPANSFRLARSGNTPKHFIYIDVVEIFWYPLHQYPVHFIFGGRGAEVCVTCAYEYLHIPYYRCVIKIVRIIIENWRASNKRLQKLREKEINNLHSFPRSALGISKYRRRYNSIKSNAEETGWASMNWI
jgi:hypothetical protein